MMATSAAPTLGDSWNRQLGDNTEINAPRPAQGKRFPTPSLTTLDLPQGNVLMIVEDAIAALELQRLLRDAGYRVVGPVSTVAETQRMIERGDIDCAILDFDVDRRAPLPIADLLAFADVPFVYLANRALASVPVWHRHRPAVERPFSRETLVAAVEEAMAKPSDAANAQRWLGGLIVPWTRVYPTL